MHYVRSWCGWCCSYCIKHSSKRWVKLTVEYGQVIIALWKCECHICPFCTYNNNNNISKWSNNFDERPHHTSRNYWGLNVAFCCILVLTIEWSIFVAFTASETPSVFQWATQPQISPFQWKDFDSHLVHGSLGPQESARQMAFHSVYLSLLGSRMLPTDTQTMLLHLWQ